MKVAAFLPAKGTSGRIKNKNLALLDAKPLFLHTLEKLTRIAEIDQVYLDTESEDIINLASHVDCQILRRDPQLADNKTDGNQLLLNQAKQVDADIYLQILGTSPFIEADTIRDCIQALIDNPDKDSAVLVEKSKMYTWENGRPNYDIDNIPNSNDLPDTIVETMGLYAIRKEALQKTQRRIGDNPIVIDAKPLEAIDVNYPEDFELANLIAAGMHEKERSLFKNLTNHLSSPVLSDVLDELGYPNQVIQGLGLSLPERKMFGRAKTLKIKKAEAGDQHDIYQAYQMYPTVRRGDIIAVETEVPEFAYFGELNANLSFRAGAVGAIIGGHTRDRSGVDKLHFPVFSKGYTCKDVKGKGNFEFMNKTIQIDGVTIEYESLIFGDSDGIVVIPKALEKAVIDKARDIIESEGKILIDINTNQNINNILGEHGNF
ncbi:cytidylyltransferase domain protein [gamma proteobacterium HTCC5015]|nr:cytidylyltransferase domain protein [gamma proteobacterium HTCC5015]